MDDAGGEHDQACPGMWLLEDLEFGEVVVELVTRYRCELCGGVLVVPPGEHPSTV